MAAEAEIAAMRRALELAVAPDAPQGPNPRVGCVILDAAGACVGEGHHRGAGSDHAEVIALRAAGERARGATAVVTLEPCNHTGRTGPCAQALSTAGVARVVYAAADASPVAQGGADALRQAGIEVEGDVLRAEAEQLNPRWTFATRRGRPFVTWKFAATLDGRSAAADGTSQWITSLAARQDVHRSRALCDALVIGTGTVLADDPQLTVRGPDGPLPRTQQPLRVVLGRRDLPTTMRVFDESAQTAVFPTHDVAKALTDLYARGCHCAWLEGGPTLAGAFLREGLVEEVVAYLAPVLLGAGRHALDDAGIATVADALRLDVTEITSIGPDLRITGSPARQEA